MPRQTVLFKVEVVDTATKIIRSRAANWPTDEWFGLSPDWDLHLGSDEAGRYAIIYPVVNQQTQTNVCIPITLPKRLTTRRKVIHWYVNARAKGTPGNLKDGPFRTAREAARWVEENRPTATYFHIAITCKETKE